MHSQSPSFLYNMSTIDKLASIQITLELKEVIRYLMIEMILQNDGISREI
jgi:hypothetical protein